MNSLSKPELAMHKLKGEHKYGESQQVQDKGGDWVLEQTCSVCGYKKRIVNPYGEQEAFRGTSTAYVSGMSSMPFYSTTQLRQSMSTLSGNIKAASHVGSSVPFIVSGINDNPQDTYEYDET